MVAAAASGCSHPPAGAEAEEEGWRFRREEAGAAAVECPTSNSSYPASGGPISKLRTIHACIASAYAFVNTTPMPHTNNPSDATKWAAIMGFISRQRIATSGGMMGGGMLALVGLILGVVGFVASVGWFFFVIVSGALNNPGATPSP